MAIGSAHETASSADKRPLGDAFFADSERVSEQIMRTYTLPGTLYYLQNLFSEVQKERDCWDIQKCFYIEQWKMEMKEKEKTREEIQYLKKRITMLEAALKNAKGMELKQEPLAVDLVKKNKKLPSEKEEKLKGNLFKYLQKIKKIESLCEKVIGSPEEGKKSFFSGSRIYNQEFCSAKETLDYVYEGLKCNFLISGAELLPKEVKDRDKEKLGESLNKLKTLKIVPTSLDASKIRLYTKKKISHHLYGVQKVVFLSGRMPLILWLALEMTVSLIASY